MKNLLLILFHSYLLTSIFAQTGNDLFSYENRLKFGNYLFCEGDYIRAIDEYMFYNKHFPNDTVQYKIAVSYAEIGQFDLSRITFESLKTSTHLKNESYNYYLSTFLLEKKYERFIEAYVNTDVDTVKNINIQKQYSVAMLLTENVNFISEKNLLSPFLDSDKKIVDSFYREKIDPHNKSELWASIFSAVIPGSGKIYTGNIVDGITSLLLTGLFTYLAVDNFNKDRTTRAYIFTGFAAFFYAGNVYGSVASAQIYNAGVRFNFENRVEMFLGNNNYFLPTVNYLCD